MIWNTVDVLRISCTGNTAMKLAWETLNVFAMYRMGFWWVLYPFPCDVLAVYLPGTPALTPSDSRCLILISFSLLSCSLSLCALRILHSHSSSLSAKVPLDTTPPINLLNLRQSLLLLPRRIRKFSALSLGCVWDVKALLMP